MINSVDQSSSIINGHFSGKFMGNLHGRVYANEQPENVVGLILNNRSHDVRNVVRNRLSISVEGDSHIQFKSEALVIDC